MYMYILVQEEMKVKPRIKSIWSASYIDVSNRCIDISNDEQDIKSLIYLPLQKLRRFVMKHVLLRQWLLSIFQSFKRLFAIAWSDWIFSSKAFPDVEERHPLTGCSICWDGILLKTSWPSAFKTQIWTVVIACGFSWRGSAVWLVLWGVLAVHYGYSC